MVGALEYLPVAEDGNTAAVELLLVVAVHVGVWDGVLDPVQTLLVADYLTVGL